MHSRHLPLLLSALLGATAFAGAPGKVPLAVEYPKPLFAGTPRPISLSNLEPAGAKRPDILVSADSKLLSRGKKVTSSDSLPVIGELSFITDGDKTGIDGAYVELGPNTQWVQVDLGASAKIDAVAVWHFHSQARVYHDVVVQISDDPEFKKGVKTIFNNDDDNSSKLGKGRDKSYVETNHGRVLPAEGAAGRYVRLFSNGNTSDELNHYCEIEVFGVAK
ncbi:MAG: discoidin domain-containing protein [Opitutaceae bacterium]